jgi:acetyl esterase/lipase
MQRHPDRHGRGLLGRFDLAGEQSGGASASSQPDPAVQAIVETGDYASMFMHVARLTAAASLLAALPAQPPPQRIPEAVRLLSDLEYARAGGRSLPLDLYLPRNAQGPVPVLVWIHGGGWSAGSKVGGPGVRLALRGYAVASVEYRLSGEAIFPAQIEDCKAAVRWLRANAARYNLDPGRIAAWGSSAGGHLAALLGTSGGVKELEGAALGNPDQSSRVQAVVDFFGPTDLLQMDAQAARNPAVASRIKHDDPKSPESRLVGGPIQDSREKAARANPIAYVTSDDPPFLIMHGDQDPLVPTAQSEILHRALRAAGVDATFHVVKDAGHGFGGPEINRMVDEFLDRSLRWRGAASPPGARPSSPPE